MSEWWVALVVFTCISSGVATIIWRKKASAAHQMECSRLNQNSKERLEHFSSFLNVVNKQIAKNPDFENNDYLAPPLKFDHDIRSISNERQFNEFKTESDIDFAALYFVDGSGVMTYGKVG